MTDDGRKDTLQQHALKYHLRDLARAMGKTPEPLWTWDQLAPDHLRELSAYSRIIERHPSAQADLARDRAAGSRMVFRAVLEEMAVACPHPTGDRQQLGDGRGRCLVCQEFLLELEPAALALAQALEAQEELIRFNQNPG